MRTIPLLALGALSVAALTLPTELPAQQPSSPYRPTATVREIMDSMIAPSAQVLWDAVGVIVTDKGVQENRPKTDEDWMKLRFAAVTLAEATNSLMIPGRAVAPPDAPAPTEGNLAPAAIAARIGENRDDWIMHAHALDDVAKDMIKAIDAKDVDAVSNVGGTMDEVCENCHLQFYYPPSP